MTTLGVLSSCVERVNHLLGATKEVLDGVELLNSTISRIVETLPDADATNNRIGEVMRQQMRELAYDIEDSVESLVRRREVEALSSSASGRALRRLFNYCWSSPEDLHSLNRRATLLVLLVESLVAAESSSRRGDLPSAEPQRVHRRQHGPESVPIGLEEYEAKLKQRLLEGGEWLSVTAVCGPGGVGKTTLAKLVYKDAEVRQHFPCGAWSTVSHDYQARNILKDLSTTLSRDTNYSKVVTMETMELTHLLYKSLKGRRYLVCLDDVWSLEAWEALRFVFPDDRNGSRVLITTRSMDVAHHVSMPGPPIEVKTLTDEQSWQLFLIKSGLQDNLGTNNPQIAEIWKPIVIRACGGLPLAIIVIGQLLSTMSLENWEQLRSGERHVHYFVDLSYTNLPFRLKPCFLYMGHFPPDQPISVEKLHLLWMAEGLISKTKEDATQDYFNQLVDRNLVVGLEKHDFLGSTRFMFGKVHDIIRGRCISRGKQEEFFEVIDFSHANQLSTSTRRLAVYLDKFKDTSNANLHIPDVKCIRTILFFDTAEPMPKPASKPTWPSELADLTDFQHIRVLDFDGVDFQVRRFPRGVEKLVYLRHLSFRGCYLQEFPSSFGNFFFLETLDLRVIDSCIMKIPNVLRKLSRLRHLYFPLAFRCDGREKLKLGCLKNLQVVENFHSGSYDTEDLTQLENLQILKGTVDGNNLDLTNIISFIENKESICHSSLVLKKFDCYSTDRIRAVTKVLTCEALHSLYLEGRLGAFPLEFAFGKNFTELVFDGSEFRENPMPILGKLPNLKSLVLCKDAIVESKLECHEAGFPRLTSLKLATLQSLEIWEVESGGCMPSLATLTIEQCNKLQMLPSELVGIPTLQTLMIGSMPDKFQHRVKEIIHSTIGANNHIISVTFYDC